MPARVDWTRDQLLLALRLYMRTPFGRLHGKNPEIIALAKKIGRTPDALAMKASNFASIDPKLNRKGLGNASRADRNIWEAFANNPTRLALEAEEAAERFDVGTEDREIEFEIPSGATEKESLVKVRRIQSFFRAAVAFGRGISFQLVISSDKFETYLTAKRHSGIARRQPHHPVERFGRTARRPQERPMPQRLDRPRLRSRTSRLR